MESQNKNTPATQPEDQFNLLRKFKTCRTDPNNPQKMICTEKIVRRNSRTGYEEVEETTETKDYEQSPNSNFKEEYYSQNWVSPFSHSYENEPAANNSFWSRLFGFPVFRRRHHYHDDFPEYSYPDDRAYWETYDEIDRTLRQIGSFFRHMSKFDPYYDPYYDRFDRFAAEPTHHRRAQQGPYRFSQSQPEQNQGQNLPKPEGN